MIMAKPGAEVFLQHHDLSSLRLGTFCAEPVNEAVHSFAVAHVTPCFIVSYWATEHGGIIWSRCHGNANQPARITGAWPLPWISGDVCILGSVGWRSAKNGEQGEVIIQQRFPLRRRLLADYM